MRIESISITKSYTGGGYDCRVAIDGEFGAVTLKLDDEHTQGVIAVVAELIVGAGKQVAENLTKAALDHKAIEYKAAG